MNAFDAWPGRLRVAALLPLLLVGLSARAGAQCVLREYTSTGTGDDGLFGLSLDCVGDVDGDGIDDFAIAGPGYHSGLGFGIATVYSGDGGGVLHTHIGSSYVQRLGMGLAGAGDIDGDGFDDYLIGESETGINHHPPGRIKAYSGIDGSVLYTIDDLAQRRAFGAIVEQVGDLDGDGVPDFWGGRSGYQDSPAAWIFSGIDGSIIHAIQTPPSTHRVFPAGDVSDLDGDGIVDVVIGVPQQDRVTALSGVDLSTLYDVSGVPGTSFGTSFAVLNDLDGDGVREFAIGAWEQAELAADGGSVTVVSGADGSVLHTIHGTIAGEMLGAFRGLAGGYDITGDGREDIAAGSQSGTLYVFDAQDGTLVATHPAGGSTVAIIVDFDGDGVRDVLAATPTGDETARILSLVAPGTNFCSATVNSTGSPAVISARGCASLAANDLVLEAGPTPSFGLFFYGPNEGQVPFGDGFRCALGGSFRLYPLESAGMSGHVSHPVDLNAHPADAGNGQILAGSTWKFQYWYRDGAAGGTGFNLSDGLSVAFRP